MKNSLDTGSFVVALITLILFVAALFSKGLSHDLFLEVGIFLVSVKLIMMAHKNNVSVGQLMEKLDAFAARMSPPPERNGADTVPATRKRKKN